MGRHKQSNPPTAESVEQLQQSPLGDLPADRATRSLPESAIIGFPLLDEDIRITNPQHNFISRDPSTLSRSFTAPDSDDDDSADERTSNVTPKDWQHALDDATEGDVSFCEEEEEDDDESVDNSFSDDDSRDFKKENGEIDVLALLSDMKSSSSRHIKPSISPTYGLTSPLIEKDFVPTPTELEKIFTKDNPFINDSSLDRLKIFFFRLIPQVVSTRPGDNHNGIEKRNNIILEILNVHENKRKLKKFFSQPVIINTTLFMAEHSDKYRSKLEISSKLCQIDQTLSFLLDQLKITLPNKLHHTVEERRLYGDFCKSLIHIYDVTDTPLPCDQIDVNEGQDVSVVNKKPINTQLYILDIFIKWASLAVIALATLALIIALLSALHITPIIPYIGKGLSWCVSKIGIERISDCAIPALVCGGYGLFNRRWGEKIQQNRLVSIKPFERKNSIMFSTPRMEPVWT